MSGEKQWELRGKPTKVRGDIALIEAGTCTVVALARIGRVIGPLSPADLATAADLGYIGADEAATSGYGQTYAWVIEDVRPLARPVSYTHPRGAITWVRLGPHGALAHRTQAPLR